MVLFFIAFRWIHLITPVFRLFLLYSSRRRHTRLQGDLSSDVCSSDLIIWICPVCFFENGLRRPQGTAGSQAQNRKRQQHHHPDQRVPPASTNDHGLATQHEQRSEERRVGKECRSRWVRYHLKKKKKTI